MEMLVLLTNEQVIDIRTPRMSAGMEIGREGADSRQVHALGLGYRTEEEEVEAAVGEVLLHQQLLVALGAPTQQPHQVAVLQLGNQLHLVPELRRTLPRPRRQTLHGDLRAAAQHALFNYIIRLDAAGTPSKAYINNW